MTVVVAAAAHITLRQDPISLHSSHNVLIRRLHLIIRLPDQLAVEVEVLSAAAVVAVAEGAETNLTNDLIIDILNCTLV